MKARQAAGPRHVVVVGGGWSGLACALSLAPLVQAGVAVSLFEAAPMAGGRARRVPLQLKGSSSALDNGQHVLLGAYSAVLRKLQALDVPVQKAFWKAPFALHYADGWTIAARDAPSPLHLLFARTAAISLRERTALGLWVARQSVQGWRIDSDCAAIALFDGHPQKLIARLWDPLCLAALNVRLTQASAVMFLAVLRDSLGAQSSDSHLLVPRQDLSALFVDGSLRALTKAGVDVHFGRRVTGVALHQERFRINNEGDATVADAMVLALPPPQAVRLLCSLQSTALSEPIRALKAIEMAPICTVYLRYDASIALPAPVMVLCEAPERLVFGQWAFDRGAMDPQAAGVISVVISGVGQHGLMSRAEVGQAVARQLSDQLGLSMPADTVVVTEKRATIVPVPGLCRPPTRLPLKALYLAGDAASSPYPSTLEGAVRSGEDAAAALLSDWHSN